MLVAIVVVNGALTQSTPSQAGLLNRLPASDAVLSIDVKRTLEEALPRALAGDPEKLAHINSEIDKFKARTGIDLRAVDQIAVGVQVKPIANQPKKAKGDAVALARGTFNPGAIVAAGRLAASGKYREEKHAGRSIYVFTLNEQVRLLGLFNMRVTELAVTELDNNTLALGTVERVRAAIDASMGRGRVNQELVTLASNNLQAIANFSAKTTGAFAGELSLLGLENPEIAKSIKSIQHLYGSVGTTTAGFDMTAVARTKSSAEAKDLGDMITAARQLANAFASQLGKDGKGKLIKSALDSMSVTAQNNEVQIRLEIAQSDLAALSQLF